MSTGGAYHEGAEYDQHRRAIPPRRVAGPQAAGRAGRRTAAASGGAVNAYCALLAERAGFRALYLSGAGVANASLGLSDLGISTLADVLEDVRRITRISALPLLVDMDTGWDGAFNITRAIPDLTAAGAAGVHIEDQVQAKRCGHRPNRAIVSADEMVDRISAAVDARTDPQFVIVAAHRRSGARRAGRGARACTALRRSGRRHDLP
jgi:methylisocitrate lyase